MESATSKMSCRLCEIRITARPCSPSRLTSASTWRGLGDAERGGRLVEDHELGVPHHGLGDRHGLALAAGEAGDGLAHGAQRGDGEALQRLARLGLHRGLVELAHPVDQLAAEVHVLDDVQVVAQREVLVDDLDAEVRRVLRAVDAHRLALEADLPAVDRVDARDALDQRRLARAVVADEGHHLARGRRGSRPRTTPGPRRSSSRLPAVPGPVCRSRRMVSSRPERTGAPRDGAPLGSILYCRPSSVHFAASFPAQISSTLGKSGSPVYSLMLSFVTLTGSRRTEGTSWVPLFTGVVCAVGSSPLASAIASSAAASASFLTAL